MNSVAAKRILEAALLCTMQPISIRDMRAMLGDAVGADTIRRLLQELQQEWTHRGLMLVQVATGWRFQSRPEMREYLERLHPEKPPKYSRAVMETLAIIAYRQPVTRGDMEDIRGVTINSTILKQLEDRGWIEVIGHREGPGRPALFATTRAFLDDLGLSSLQDLPALDAQDVTHALAKLGQADAPAQVEHADSRIPLAANTPGDLQPPSTPAADGADPAAPAQAVQGSEWASEPLVPSTVLSGPEGQTESQP